MKSIILGDCHIGRSLSIGKPGIGTKLNSRIVDQLSILDYVLSYAIDISADNLFLTGDVFHDINPSSTIISLFIGWLKSVSDAGIKAFIIAGNHELTRSAQNYMSVLDIIHSADIENVFVFKQIHTVHFPDTSFTLLPFRDRKSFNTDSNSTAINILKNQISYEFASIPILSTKVLIGHLAIEGSIPVGDEIDDLMNELYCPTSMFSGYNYSVFGHVHRNQILSQFPFVSHIGSMDLSDFGEQNQKKYVGVLSNSNFEYVEIPTRPLNQISISVPEDVSNTTDFIIDQLKTHNNLSKSILKLNIEYNNSDIYPLDRKIIESYLTEKNVFHIAKINEQRKIAAIKKVSANIDTSMDENAAIRMYANENISEEMRNDFITTAMGIVKECN
jgi:DNA repair exonuclease SbcCD nuclease subunit